MQGIGSLDKFKNFVSSICGLGRFEDTYIVHAAEGETVVPMEVFDRNPVLKERLFESMRDMGIEPERYIVCNQLNSINPITGQPEFFLKKIFKRIKKGVRDVGSRLRKAAADVSGYAAPIAGALYGPAAGALVGGLLGQYKRENPGDPNQALQMALRGGIAGLGTNIATGQGFGLGGGLRGAYNLQTFDPLAIGKEFVSSPLESVLRPKTEGANIIDRLKILDSFGLGGGQTTPGGGGGGNLSSSELTAKIGNLPESSPEFGKLIKGAQNLSNVATNEVSTSVLDKILKNAGILKSAATFASIYGTFALGNAIKAEQEQQKKDMAKFQGPFGERGTDEQLLALLATPELISAPDTALAAAPVYSAEGGGVTDLRQGGESVGPGTGTSDDIPAMLSDGEFVMTAKAVRGAGGGDRREGAKKMYQMMDQLEARA